MPPESDGSIKTIGCSLKRLVPNEDHLKKIEDGVHRVHRASFLASELLNLHLRKCIDDKDESLKNFFDANWILKAFNEVTCINGQSRTLVDQKLHDTRLQHMMQFETPSRSGIQQCLLYEGRNIATVASNNVWMHFKKRIFVHVKRHIELGDVIVDEGEKKRMVALQLTSDICKAPHEKHQSKECYYSWVQCERKRLGIDDAVGEWNNKPILYHLKSKPYDFVRIMAKLSLERENNDGAAFALFPLRRTFVPRHARFDQKALRDLLSLGSSATSKKRKRDDCDGQSKRRSKDDMKEEKSELFANVLNLRAANVQQKWQFDFAFTTDGVCARLQMRKKNKKQSHESSRLPRRGIWAIDQLKHQSRLDDMHVIGVDPGKRELIVGVDMDDPKHSSAIRYTQKQRFRDMRSEQYRVELMNEKNEELKNMEKSLAGFNSRSASLDTFRAYCNARRAIMNTCMSFYSNISHRKRRWKSYMKSQKSEENLFCRLKAIQKDNRPLVLAYGSWGMIAGRPGMVCNKGNAPCIGIGLMRKLATRFVVVPTPEAYTSKTCCNCMGECGRWKEVEDIMLQKQQKKRSEIRGLRVCQNTECRIPLNRDKNGATNIGTNFKRLFSNQPPIREMTSEDLALHRASLCVLCDDE